MKRSTGAYSDGTLLYCECRDADIRTGVLGFLLL